MIISGFTIIINMADIPWKQGGFERKWATKPVQTVNSPQYKQLKKYIHLPYRKVDHVGVKCYYFPTYVIFKIKNITEFNFESLSANINGVLIIKTRIDYKDEFSPDKNQNDQAEVRQALEKLFKFRFSNIKKKPNDKKSKNQMPEQPKRSLQQQQIYEQQKDKEVAQLKKYLYVQFNRDDPLRLPTKRIFKGQIKQEEKDQDEDGQIITWTIRKQFTIALAPGTFWQDLIAPFNLLNFKLTMSFEEVDLNLKKNQVVKFKFNCMKRVGNDSPQERKHIFQQLIFTDDGSLGEYDLAETSLRVSCQKYLSKQHDNDMSSVYRSFKIITFNIPFYKYPIMDALTIFIPLVLITILTLFTFVQGPDFNDKIGNIATLMIVYVGLMPVISDSLPPTTSITLIDFVVYCQLTISVLCLIRGYIIKEYSPDQFNNYFVWQDSVFRLSVAIAIVTAIILIFLLVYYCINKSFYYNLEEADIDESDRKLVHWVSPHMHTEARNVKTEIQKISAERLKNNNRQGVMEVSQKMLR